MKKPVKIIFSVVLSVAMVLSLALTAYGASSLTSDFAVTVEKGKVFDENGDLYTCLLYTSPSPRDVEEYRMPSSA